VFFPFSIWFYSKSGQRGTRSNREEGQRPLSLWGPLSVRKMREGSGAAQVDSAHGFGPHMSRLMRHRKDEPGLCKISFFQRFSPAPKSGCALLRLPSLHPIELLASNCTQEIPWLNLSLPISLIFFLQFILIDPFIQKLWKFHQNSLNSWSSPLYF
jgi:hypothetical protein